MLSGMKNKITKDQNCLISAALPAVSLSAYDCEEPCKQKKDLPAGKTTVNAACMETSARSIRWYALYLGRN